MKHLRKEKHNTLITRFFCNTLIGQLYSLRCLAVAGGLLRSSESLKLACKTGVIFCVFLANRGEREASAKRELRSSHRTQLALCALHALASLSPLFPINTQKITPVLQTTLKWTGFSKISWTEQVQALAIYVLKEDKRVREWN